MIITTLLLPLGHIPNMRSRWHGSQHRGLHGQTRRHRDRDQARARSLHHATPSQHLRAKLDHYRQYLVAAAAQADFGAIGFRRNFGLEETLAWEELRAKLPSELNPELDSVSWRLSASGTFSVSSAYRALFSGPTLSWPAHLWKAPLPLKTKIFVWQLLRVRLPTGVEVAKRHGPGTGYVHYVPSRKRVHT